MQPEASSPAAGSANEQFYVCVYNCISLSAWPSIIGGKFNCKMSTSTCCQRNNGKAMGDSDSKANKMATRRLHSHACGVDAERAEQRRMSGNRSKCLRSVIKSALPLQCAVATWLECTNNNNKYSSSKELPALLLPQRSGNRWQ